MRLTMADPLRSGRRSKPDWTEPQKLDTNFWVFFMTKYNEQFKLTVVRQYLDGRQGYKSVANDHGLDHTMVKRWVDRYRQHGIAGLQKKFNHYNAEFRLSVLQRMWREQLIAEVNHLRMKVAYLKKLRALVQAQQQQRTNARKKRK